MTRNLLFHFVHHEPLFIIIIVILIPIISIIIMLLAWFDFRKPFLNKKFKKEASEKNKLRITPQQADLSKIVFAEVISDMMPSSKKLPNSTTVKLKQPDFVVTN